MSTKIKDATRAQAADGILLPVSDGSNRPKNITLGKVKEYVVEDMPDLLERFKRDLGFNDSVKTVTLQQGIAGKYVKCATRVAANNTAFAISQPIEIEACSELLIKTGFNPSDASHAGLDLSVISFVHEIERQRTVQKKNAGGQLLYYVVEYDDDGNEKVTEAESTVVTSYPVYTQETYTETVYTPNNEDRWVAIPDSGYYVANIPDTAKIVVSYKPGVTDTQILICKHGMFANIVSQLGMLAFKERLPMTQIVAQLTEAVKNLIAGADTFGNAVGKSIDVQEYRCNKYPMVLYGHGTPSASIRPVNLGKDETGLDIPWVGTPECHGQQYINLDAASGGLYYSVPTIDAYGIVTGFTWKQA